MYMELQRPRLTPVLPQWDLGIVPEALSKPPYEPLREASLKHLTLKTVFLLAMADHKLTVYEDRPGHSRRSDRGDLLSVLSYVYILVARGLHPPLLGSPFF